MNTSQGEAHILRLFERARVMPSRNPIAAERGHRRFVERVEALRPSGAFIIFPGWGSRRLAWAITSVLLASALLLSGIGVAQAASSTLPNEALYPVKIAIEELQIALSADDAADAFLLLQFSQRRIDEITALAGQQQFEQIAIPAGHYHTALDQLTAIIAGLMEAGEPRADQLSALFMERLIEYEQTLSALLETLTPVENRDIEMALSFSDEVLASGVIWIGGEVTEIEPSRGEQGQTLTLEITGEGTGFGSISLVDFGPGVTVNWVYTESQHRLIVNITIEENAPLGLHEVIVTTGPQSIGGIFFEVEDGMNLEASDDEDLPGQEDNELDGEQEDGDDGFDDDLGEEDGVTDGQLDGGGDGEHTSDDVEPDDEVDEED